MGISPGYRLDASGQEHEVKKIFGRQSKLRIRDVNEQWEQFVCHFRSRLIEARSRNSKLNESKVISHPVYDGRLSFA